MCKCCVLYCSQRRNVYTLREAEHVHAHTVETTLAQLEHHNKKGCQGNRTQENGEGVVLTPRTPQLGEVWCCDDISDYSKVSYSNLYILNVYHFHWQRAVVTQRLRDPTKPLCGPVLPAMQTPQACNQAFCYHAWS